VISALLPAALTTLTADRRVVLVSGTNGKTTTTLLLSRALQSQGEVLSNSDGANLVSGLLATLSTREASRSGTAVLEVDEVALVTVLAQVAADVVVLLNLSRDQLDRTSEVTNHMRAWTQALQHVPGACVVANADDALVVASVLGARPDGSNVVWVGAGKPCRMDTSACPRCGGPWDASERDWVCALCGLHRPPCRWSLDAGALVVDDRVVPLGLSLPGRANASNAVVALAAADVLGVDPHVGLERMREVRDVAGRYAQVAVHGRPMRLLLAKNPAGWLEALDQVAEGEGPVVIAINARAADGVDPSWLWDVPFEALRGRQVMATGDRGADLAVRLRYAGVDHEMAPTVEAALELLPALHTDVVANYTAFSEVRQRLFPA
jgi:UDP-N-acetylmuramyl tripeptide synthase